MVSSIKVSPASCLRAMRTHHTPYGKLSRHRTYEWQTTTHSYYSCSWKKTKTKQYNHFRLIAYPAQLRGRDSFIQQHVTRTKCHYNRHHCQPFEMPYSQIVWKGIKHDHRLYHSVGRYKLHKLNNYL